MSYFDYNVGKSSLRSIIHNSIKESILEGKYSKGENLIESKLAKELGVSRTPIREALRQLELEGFVESIPNKGVIVSGISQQDIEDIYEIRSLIEGLAVRRAIERIEPEQLKKLEEILELTEFYTMKEDVKKWSELDTEFHSIIFKASKSRPLWSVLSNFHHFIQKPRLYSITIEGRLKIALNEHKEIFNAFIEKNPEKGEKAIISHVLKAKDNLRKILKEKNSLI